VAYIRTHDTKQTSRGKVVKRYEVVYRAKVREHGRAVTRLRQETYITREAAEARRDELNSHRLIVEFGFRGKAGGVGAGEGTGVGRVVNYSLVAISTGRGPSTSRRNALTQPVEHPELDEARQRRGVPSGIPVTDGPHQGSLHLCSLPGDDLPLQRRQTLLKFP
jgi:hypothetical protein